MNDLLPRERLLEKGPRTLSDRELLCVLLGTGPHGVEKLAQDLFLRFGDLRGILSARPHELRAVNGIGSSKLSSLLAVGELALRLWHAGRGRDSSPILRAHQAYYLFSELALEDQEVVMAAFLGSRNRLLGTARVFRGTADSSLARPREILREALRVNAVKCLVAHNHPSQATEPSDEDVLFTAEMEWAAETVGIPLVDHLIICGGGKYFSFAEAGLLRRRETAQPTAEVGARPVSVTGTRTRE